MTISVIKKLLTKLRLWRKVSFFANRKLRNFLLDKKVTIVTVVSLCCTPIGRPFAIRKSRNFLLDKKGTAKTVPFLIHFYASSFASFTASCDFFLAAAFL